MVFQSYLIYILKSLICTIINKSIYTHKKQAWNRKINFQKEIKKYLQQ